MKPLPQKIWIAVNPQGRMCGPAGDTEGFVRKALVGGYRRTANPFGVWKDLERLGYKVIQVLACPQ